MSLSTLPHNDRRVQYAASAGQVEFWFDFPLARALDLSVTRKRAGDLTTLTAPADYAVENLEQSGGTVVLSSPAVEGDVIDIFGSRQLERTTNYILRGNFTSEEINADFDHVYIILQELSRDFLLSETKNLETLQFIIAAAAAVVEVGDLAIALQEARDNAERSEIIIAAVEQARVAAEQSAQDAAAYANSGIAIADGTGITDDFTVAIQDFHKLHLLEPSEDQTLAVTMPPANEHIGNIISFRVPHFARGLVRFLATPSEASSLIDDYLTDKFVIWAKETLTLVARSDRWHILDWKKSPLFLKASASNVSESLASPVVVSHWSTTFKNTYLNSAVFAINDNQQVVLPRRGQYRLDFNCFIDWSASGAPPSSLYCDILGIAGAGSINNRQYADYIQAANATQSVIKYSRIIHQNEGTIIEPKIFALGGVNTRLYSSIARPQIMLSEIV